MALPRRTTSCSCGDVIADSMRSASVRFRRDDDRSLARYRFLSAWSFAMAALVLWRSAYSRVRASSRSTLARCSPRFVAWSEFTMDSHALAPLFVRVPLRAATTAVMAAIDDGSMSRRKLSILVCCVCYGVRPARRPDAKEQNSINMLSSPSVRTIIVARSSSRRVRQCIWLLESLSVWPTIRSFRLTPFAGPPTSTAAKARSTLAAMPA